MFHLCFTSRFSLVERQGAELAFGAPRGAPLRTSARCPEDGVADPSWANPEARAQDAKRIEES